MSDALHTAYTFALTGGLILGALGVITAKPFLRLLNTPEDLMSSSVLYVQILMAGLVFTLIYNMASGILRAIGDSKRPLYILIACCGLNIVLDLFFVMILHWGVFGAALATILCQAFSAVIITWLLMQKTPGMQLSFRKLRIRRVTLARILRIGLPTALAGSMFSIANMVVQTSLNRMGVDVIAAWTAYSKIDSIWWMINQAFSVSITTFVGQNYGACLPDRVRKGTHQVLAMEITVGIAAGIFLYFASPVLLRLFADSEEVISIGNRMAKVMAPYYWIFAVSEIYGSALRAENYVMVNTVVNLVGVCVFRIVWLTFIVPNGSIESKLACFPISWVLISLLITVYYFHMQPKILNKLTA